MINLRIVCVGKTPVGAYRELEEQYKKYLKAFARLEVVEVKSLDEMPTGEHVILLDERGKDMTSLEFAKLIGACEDHGESMTFVIGGAFGFSSEFKKEARHMIRLSTLTLPHDLAKVVLLEQLYRACTINHGKSYHY